MFLEWVLILAVAAADTCPAMGRIHRQSLDQKCDDVDLDATAKVGSILGCHRSINYWLFSSYRPHMDFLPILLFAILYDVHQKIRNLLIIFDKMFFLSIHRIKLF